MEDRLSVRDLLDAWREATLAAELAERLAGAASAAADAADASASAAEEIAELAEAAATAADHAATAARAAAVQARGLASGSRHVDLRDAEGAISVAHVAESAARERYQRAVKEAERRHSGQAPGKAWGDTAADESLPVMVAPARPAAGIAHPEPPPSEVGQTEMPRP